MSKCDIDRIDLFLVSFIFGSVSLGVYFGQQQMTRGFAGRAAIDYSEENGLTFLSCVKQDCQSKDRQGEIVNLFCDSYGCLIEQEEKND